MVGGPHWAVPLIMLERLDAARRWRERSEQQKQTDQGALVGLTLKEAAAKGREFVEWSDTAIEKTPLVNEVLAIQSTIFDVADMLGLGEEVRAMVYAIRGTFYVSTAATNLGLSGAGAAGAGLVASLGAVGALAAGGAVVAVVAFFAGLFSDDSDEYAAKKKKARQRAREELLDLLTPQSLAGFAAEQDRIASAPNFGGLPDTAQQKDARVRALKLSQFFRLVGTRLNRRERQVFEGVLNISRWGQAHDLYEGLSPTDKGRIARLLYEGKLECPNGILDSKSCVPADGASWPDYGAMLRHARDQALSRLTPRGGSSVNPLLLVAAAGVVWFLVRRF